MPQCEWMHLVNRRSLSHRLSFRAERNAISTWTDVPSLSLVVVSQKCSGGEASIVWGHNDSNRCPAPLASSKQHQDQDVNNTNDDWSKGCTVVGSCPCNPNRGMSLNEDQTWHNTKLKHIDTPVPMEVSATPANFTSQTSIMNACHLRKQMVVLPVDDIKTVYWPQAELHLAKISQCKHHGCYRDCKEFAAKQCRSATCASNMADSKNSP